MRRFALLVLALLLVLVPAGCGGGDDDGSKDDTRPQGPAVRPFLGVSPGGPLLASPRLLGREVPVMARSGVTSLRVPFYWNQTERGRGELDFDQIDTLVATAARARLEILPVVQGTPAWAAAKSSDAASPPRDPKDYTRFLGALIARYGPQGSFWNARPELPKVAIRNWQIWNEPSHEWYWSTQPWAPSYTRLLRASRQAIRAGDPGAKTVLAGLPDRSWESLRQILDAGGKGAFDVAGIHPYTARVENVLKIVELNRGVLRSAGEGDTPMWLTEVSWSSSLGKVEPEFAFGIETTERGQADRLAEALPLLASKRQELGIERMYWESWLSAGKNPRTTWDWAGLRELGGSGDVREKPAFGAFVRVAQRLRGS